MKYIPADKLIANLRRQKHELELSIQSQGDYGQSCQIVAYENILSLITFLQQEQLEFVNKIWHKISEEANLTRPVVLSDGDKYMSPPCTFPFKDMSEFVNAMNKRYKAVYTIWAYMDDLLNISYFQREQPEADLDAEIDKFLYGTKFKRDYDGVHVPGVCVRDWKGKKYTNRDVTPDDMRNFARHFAEWGAIHLNAKKEE